MSEIAKKGPLAGMRVGEKVAHRAFNPKSVPGGARVAPKTKGGARKAKPNIGRGQYVKAPLLRDKMTNPRWMANAIANNPGNAVAGAGIGGGAAAFLGPKRKVEKRDNKDLAAGAAVGAGAGHFARVGADYGTKATAERQFKPFTTKGNYGPYTDSPHKPVLNKYKREAQKNGGSNVRSKAKYFDEHFPKGVPSYKARKVGAMLGKKPAVAGAAAVGAAVGAGVTHRIKKNMSAFGVEHV
jgi:hypothetical protein